MNKFWKWLSTKRFSTFFFWLKFQGSKPVKGRIQQVSSGGHSAAVGSFKLVKPKGQFSTRQSLYHLISKEKDTTTRTTSFSYVNSIMTAVAARTIQAVRPHVPLVKFIGRRPNQPKFDPNNYLRAQHFDTALASESFPATSKTTVDKPEIGLSSRGSGIDESQLPVSFRRRLLDEEEIEVINAGGRYG